MAEYLTPGQYFEKVPSAPVFRGVSTTTGAMIGITQRGEVGRPTLVTSWDNYVNKYANGVDSPFMADSDLAYGVYGFFQNGGRKIYIGRAASPTAAKAVMVDDSFVVPDVGDVPDYEPPVIEAMDEGEWGNKLNIVSVENEDVDDTYNVTVYIGDDPLETYAALSNDTASKNYWIDKINKTTGLLRCVSGYLTETPTTTSGSDTTYEPAKFEGGADGILDIVDNDFMEVIKAFDEVDDFTLFAIPGQTSASIISAVTTFVDLRKDNSGLDIFAFLEAPHNATLEEVRALRKTISCKAANLLHPWIKVNDPLSRTNVLREIPPSGHAMGTYARIMAERGAWKAPAGTEANLRGALEVVTKLKTGDTDVLNPISVISIVPKTNYGIVIWGARSLSPDPDMPYVSDVLLDIYMKKSIYFGTFPFVFEPNNQRTWTRLETAVQTFLHEVWKSGGLVGANANEAFFVRCNAETNPPETRAQGKLIAEYGYAASKPSEFVIFRVSHTMQS